MVRRKRLNAWRKAGRFEFRRETRRLSDGTPWGEGAEVLYVRVKGKGCAFATTDAKGAEVWSHDYTYRRYGNPVKTAHQFRAYLIAQIDKA